MLVHEALLPPGTEALLQTVDPSLRDGIRQHLLNSHTKTTDVAAVAKCANATRLAFTHYTPGSSRRRRSLRNNRGCDELGCGGEVLAPSEFDTIVI